MSENCTGLILLQNIYKSWTKYIDISIFIEQTIKTRLEGFMFPERRKSTNPLHIHPRPFLWESVLICSRPWKSLGDSDLCVTKK